MWEINVFAFFLKWWEEDWYQSHVCGLSVKSSLAWRLYLPFLDEEFILCPSSSVQRLRLLPCCQMRLVSTGSFIFTTQTFELYLYHELIMLSAWKQLCIFPKMLNYSFKENQKKASFSFFLLFKHAFLAGQGMLHRQHISKIRTPTSKQK